jgi:hypothetical protein
MKTELMSFIRTQCFGYDELLFLMVMSIDTKFHIDIGGCHIDVESLIGLNSFVSTPS